MINYFLLTFLILLVVWPILKKLKKIVKHGESDSYLKTEVPAGRTKLRRPLYLLDGLYLLYRIQKYGVNVFLEWMARIEDDTIVEVFLGPIKLVTSKNAKLSHKLLGSSDPGHLSRPLDIYHRIFVDFMSKGLFGTDPGEWLHQRKAISKAFTFRTFQHYVKIMNKHSKNLASDLKKLVDGSGGTACGSKMYDTIHHNTQKITLEFLLGADFSESIEALEFSKSLLEAKEIVTHRLLHPELYFPLFWWLHPKRWAQKKTTKQINSFVTMAVEHYQKKSELEGAEQCDENNLQRCLIEEMIKQNACPEEIYCETGTFLIAGFETVLGALKLLLQHLACHPDYQTRCRQEVDNLLGPYNSESDTSRDLSVSDLSKLEYMERLINESMRIAPTVPVMGRELKSPLKIDDDHSLKEGTVVMISPLAIHHNPKYYPDPEIFNPDRFLPEEVEKREPGAFIPFSAGMRNCIGKRFAMLEMKTLLTWILRNFEVYSEDGMQDVKIRFEITLVPERDFKISLNKRDIQLE